MTVADVLCYVEETSIRFVGVALRRAASQRAEGRLLGAQRSLARWCVQSSLFKWIPLRSAGAGLCSKT